MQNNESIISIIEAVDISKNTAEGESPKLSLPARVKLLRTPNIIIAFTQMQIFLNHKGIILTFFLLLD